jgi:hypothetical protein
METPFSRYFLSKRPVILASIPNAELLAKKQSLPISAF